MSGPGTQAARREAASDDQSHPVTDLPGVGPKLAARLAKLGVHRVQDLLFHLPLRYQDRTRVTPIGELRPGADAVVIGRIEQSSITFGRRRSLVTQIHDGTGALNMRLFYFNARQKQGLCKGNWIRCIGEARPGRGTKEMIHPEYHVSAEPPVFQPGQRLTPIYPSTDGLSQRTLRQLVDSAFVRAWRDVVDWLPAEIAGQHRLTSLSEALESVHRPAPSELTALEQGQHPAQQRLAFEELLAHHVSLRRLRERRRRHEGMPMRRAECLWSQIRRELGFTLTNAQQRVIGEVASDLRATVPAMRLIQGDVGSGKTVIAAAAACQAIEAGYQVALMAPTELLAEQHLRSFRAWFEPLGVEVCWLAGKLRAAPRRQALERIAGGAPLVVGTHALYQEGVTFSRLGLMIVDEQHRFGVDQRLALRHKGPRADKAPHQLTLTATPIPRSLAMVFYADLDVSSIDELPPGRKPVETVVVPNTRREEVRTRVQASCSQGRQAYWVCPVIDESEILQVQAATETETTLKAAFPNLRIALVHGRMRAADKDSAMRRFRDGDTDLLVATTVVEVGVDVPNASLMIIENAERLGLAQLHQLRGRVGRGSARATCVLMYQPPLSAGTRQRLAIIRRTNDGFEIARQDLQARGPGEVLGTRQTGPQRLYVADLVRDQHLLPQIEQAGTRLLESHAANIEPLIRRWVRARDKYATV